MKWKLFSHTDLDGVTPAVLTNYFFGSENVDYKFCSYNDIDTEVNKFLDGQIGYYEQIFITDISVNEETAKRIDYYIEMTGQPDRFVLIDHHATAEWLNKYGWAHVQPEETVHGRMQKTSGTSLFLEYLKKKYPEKYIFFEDTKQGLKELTEKVRRYDTWEWSTYYHDNTAKELNDLFYIIGKDEYIRRFTFNPYVNFDASEKMILRLEQNRIKKYIDAKEKNMYTTKIGKHVAAVIFAESYISELGNVLATRYPNIDLIIMIDMSSKRVSFRTAKDNVDVSAIAATYGGGGHPKASGCSIATSHAQKLIMDMLGQEAEKWVSK